MLDLLLARVSEEETWPPSGTGRDSVAYWTASVLPACFTVPLGPLQRGGGQADQRKSFQHPQTRSPAPLPRGKALVRRPVPALSPGRRGSLPRLTSLPGTARRPPAFPPEQANPASRGAHQRSPPYSSPRPPSPEEGNPPPRHATPPRNGHRRGPAVANPPAGRGRPSTRRPEAEEETAAPFYLRFWRGERPRPHPRSPVSLPTPPAAGKGGTAAAALEPGSGAAPPPPPTPALRAPAAPYLCRRPRCLRAVRRPSRRQSCEAGARRPPSPSSAAPACQRGRSGRGEAASRGAGAWGRPAGEGRRGARRGRGGGGGTPTHRGLLPGCPRRGGGGHGKIPWLVTALGDKVPDEATRCNPRVGCGGSRLAGARRVSHSGGLGHPERQ